MGDPWSDPELCAFEVGDPVGTQVVNCGLFLGKACVKKIWEDHWGWLIWDVIGMGFHASPWIESAQGTFFDWKRGFM